MNQSGTTDPAVEAVLDEMADALDAMRERACPMMAVIWLAYSARMRKRFVHLERLEDETELPARWFKTRPFRSRYGIFSVWRHGVLWKGAEVPDLHGQALEEMYFTEFPQDVPPYAWSQATPDHASLEACGGRRGWKNQARDGAKVALEHLRDEVKKNPGIRPSENLERELLERLGGAGGAIESVLKFEGT